MANTDVNDPASLLSSRAFEEVVRPYLSVMRRAALVANPRGDPDDVVQESMLRAWRKWSTYDPQLGSVRVWLLAIVVNQARRMCRRRGGYEVGGLAEDAGLIAAGEDRADLDLRDAVNALPKRQRQTVLLYYYVDLSVEDTAVLMGCAVGTVKSTLADARASLLVALGGKHG